MKRIISMILALVMVADSAAVAAPPFPEKMQKALNELVGAPGRTYKSNDAIDVLLDDYLPNRRVGFTPQQALDHVVSEFPSAATDYIPTVSFVWDDITQELWGSTDSLFMNASPSQRKMRIRDILYQFGIVGGLSIEMENALNPGSTNLSVAMMLDLKANGWDTRGTVGRDEVSAMYNGDSSLLAQGYTQAQVDTFYNNILHGKQMQENRGLGKVKWISYSNSSGCWITKQAAARNGIWYGFQSGQSVTVGSDGGARPNALYLYRTGSWGMFGTGGTQPRLVVATPTTRCAPMEIAQCVGENSDSATWYQTIRKARQTKGWVVSIAHRASAMETSLAGQNGFYTLCQTLATLRDAGKIQILTPSDAIDYYYKRHLSEVVNVKPGKGQLMDLDNDTHWDWWGGTSLAPVAADTAKVKLVAPASLSHNGTRSFRLAFAGTGVQANTFWGAATNDSTWRYTQATLGDIPPRGRLYKVHFECWVACDTTVASARRPGISGNAKADYRTAGKTWVGVVFYGPKEQWRSRNDGSPSYGMIYDHNTTTWALASVPSTGASGTPFNTSTGNALTSNFVFLTKANSINSSRGSAGTWEWAHLTAEWVVPSISDYLFASIVKHGAFPADEIVISDYSLTYTPLDLEGGDQ